MNRPIAISLSPNTDVNDMRLARTLLFVHSYWNKKDILSRAAQKIAERFPRHFVSLASSGRQALYDLLRSYDIQKGDEVIIQAFTCIAVPEPIVWTGATPIYADLPDGRQVLQNPYSIDPEDVKKKITSHTKAIILQHTFGIPGPIKEILAIAKQYNLIVIEDCAHVFGAMYEGKPLGTFGDAAILSFGRDKSLSSVFGGATITQDKNRAHALRKMQASRKLPPRLWVVQQLFHVVFFQYVLPLYFWYGLGKLLIVLAQRLGLLGRAVAYEERLGKRPVHFHYSYSPALALLLLAQLEKIDTMNQKRKKIAERYQAELHHSFKVPEQYSTVPLLRFPILVDNAKGILLDARSHNMLLGDWYDSALVPGASDMGAFHYIPGSCPRAEETANRIINLPTYPTLTDTQITKVIAFINKYAHTGN